MFSGCLMPDWSKPELLSDVGSDDRDANGLLQRVVTRDFLMRTLS